MEAELRRGAEQRAIVVGGTCTGLVASSIRGSRTREVVDGCSRQVLAQEAFLEEATDMVQALRKVLAGCGSLARASRGDVAKIAAVEEKLAKANSILDRLGTS